MSAILDLLYLGGLGLSAPVLAVRRLAGRRPLIGGRLGDRLGLVPERQPGTGPLAWIHAVSVGEVNLARTFAEGLTARQEGWNLAVSTGTTTGQEQAERVFPDAPVFYFPLDLSPCVRAAWGRLKPDLVALMELEVWPNHMEVALRLGRPVVVINGRITERTARRYGYASGIFKPAFRALAMVCAQNETYAERFRTLGVHPDRIVVTGNLKYDLPEPESAALPVAEIRDQLVREIGAPWLAEGPVLVGGSTHAPEEGLLARLTMELRAAGVPDLQLVVAPRHVERAEEAVRACREAGLNPVRRSHLGDGTPTAEAESKAPRALVLDTIGELTRFYSVADVVYVGGSFNDRGGQNVLEPAALGKPVVVGPNTRNFHDIVSHLKECRGLIQVDDEQGLREVLHATLADEDMAAAMGARARAAIDELAS